MRFTIGSPGPSAESPAGDASSEADSEPEASAAARETRRALVLALAFFCVAALGAVQHELWRDEWQAWMIARDSATILELLQNLRPEGHPPGWYFILFVLSRVTRNVAIMQAFHVVVATASVYLLARYAPLPWVQRVLIAFGYFIAYEYAVIARAYVIAVFALFAFCAFYPRWRQVPLRVIAMLVLLASGSVYGLIIAIAATCMLVLEVLIDWPWRWRHVPRTLVVGIWLTTVAVTVLVGRPLQGFSAGAAPRVHAFSQWQIAASTGTLPWAYLPVPDPGARHIWNTHIVPDGTRAWLVLRLAIASVIVTGAALLFMRRPLVLLMFAAGTGGLLLFQHIFFVGTLRHHGHLFLLFVTCLWLARLRGITWRPPQWLDRLAGPETRGARGFVMSLLLIQVLAAAILYTADLRQPFSAAPGVARLLKERGLADLPILVSPAPAGSSIAGELDRPVFYLATQSHGTFLRWTDYAEIRDTRLDMPALRPFIDAAPGDVVVILGAPFSDWDGDLKATEVGRFPAGLERTEGYVVYRVTRTGAPLS